MKTATLLALGIIAVGALSLLPAAMAESMTEPGMIMPETNMESIQTDEGPLPATISITNSGIVDNIAQTPGLHIVTVTNDSSSPRGLVLKGTDAGVSRYVRFTRILRPGESQTFRWFFPEDRTVTITDLLHCTHLMRTCALPRTGHMVASVAF